MSERIVGETRGGIHEGDIRRSAGKKYPLFAKYAARRGGVLRPRKTVRTVRGGRGGGVSYAPGRNNTSCASRPWGSKVQRRDCIGSAKEQTSTDTLYLHGFMSNQPALPRANCLFLKPI